MVCGTLQYCTTFITVQHTLWYKIYYTIRYSTVLYQYNTVQSSTVWYSTIHAQGNIVLSTSSLPRTHYISKHYIKGRITTPYLMKLCPPGSAYTQCRCCGSAPVTPRTPWAPGTAWASTSSCSSGTISSPLPWWQTESRI